MGTQNKVWTVVLILSLTMNVVLGGYALLRSPEEFVAPTTGDQELLNKISALEDDLARLQAENEGLRQVEREEPETNAPEPAVQDQTTHAWYFRRNATHQPPSTDPAFVEMLKGGKGFYLGDPQSKKIYLTFDEGYENGYTGRILDILRDNGVRAAFFVTGPYVKDQAQLVQRMVSEGHVVGNHTQHHPSMPGESNAVLRDEILSVHEQVKKLTGQDMAFLRPPMGEFNQRTIDLTSNLGYRTVFWSMAYKDWDVNDQPGRDAALKHVLDNVHPGAVILLHAVSQSNTEALDTIIKELKGQGYVFASLNEIAR